VHGYANDERPWGERAPGVIRQVPGELTVADGGRGFVSQNPDLFPEPVPDPHRQPRRAGRNRDRKVDQAARHGAFARVEEFGSPCGRNGGWRWRHWFGRVLVHGSARRVPNGDRVTEEPEPVEITTNLVCVLPRSPAIGRGAAGTEWKAGRVCGVFRTPPADPP